MIIRSPEPEVKIFVDKDPVKTSFEQWAKPGHFSRTIAKGPDTTTWIWNLHADAHDFDGHTSDLEEISRKVFSAHFGQLSIIFLWLSGMYFHALMLFAGWFHYHKAAPKLAWFQDVESMLNHHLAGLLGLGGSNPIFTLNWSKYADFLTFRGGLDPVTGGLWLTDIAHHHLAIAILFLAGHMYRTNWGIGHGLKDILEAHKGPFTGQGHKGLYEILTTSWHAQLSLNLAMLGSLTIVVAHHMYSMPPYPYLATDYGTQLSLFTHHMWIGGFLIVGAAAHAAIFMVRDYDPTTRYNDLLDRVLRHRDAIISHLNWACIFLGFHSFGLYIHNDTMSALGRPQDMFSDTAIQLQPVFAQWIQNTHALAPGATAPGATASTSLTWGGGDLVAGRQSGFVTYSVRNRGFFVIFRKMQSDVWGSISDQGVVTHITGGNFAQSSITINGWLRDFLWAQASQVIQSYGSSLSAYGLFFLDLAHAIWDPHFGKPAVEAFTRGGALGPVNIAYSGVYQWWLATLTTEMETERFVVQKCESRLNHHLSGLFGVSSLAWTGHLVHVAIPGSRGERRLNGLAYADEIKKRACSALTSNWVKRMESPFKVFVSTLEQTNTVHMVLEHPRPSKITRFTSCSLSKLNQQAASVSVDKERIALVSFPIKRPSLSPADAKLIIELEEFFLSDSMLPYAIKSRTISFRCKSHIRGGEGIPAATVGVDGPSSVTVRAVAGISSASDLTVGGRTAVRNVHVEAPISCIDEALGILSVSEVGGGEIHGSEGGKEKLVRRVKRPHAMPRTTRKGDKWEKNSSPKGVDMVYRQKKKSNQKQLASKCR
ncbi:UNVERIFIED_CONTAM: Photosystem I chlorophyll a apoprotein A1 [Sesamum calycinum]|uniref:Photosystem I chlorophyll a apoprotein A1 n=1 Tax=Sesamum calycinum TaxID=2727403 RepID=A0AAW2J536_9LAMI